LEQMFTTLPLPWKSFWNLSAFQVILKTTVYQLPMLRP
jgi:hypothetical protein